MKLLTPPFLNSIVVSVQLYAVLEDVGLIDGYLYCVQETTETCLISIQKLKKVFCVNLNSSTEVSTFIIKLLDAFEHF